MPTKIVIGLSNVVSYVLGSIWYITFPLVIATVFGAKALVATPKGRYAFDAALLKVPLVGMVLRKIAVARFTRTLGTLMASGVPILEGLAITARTSGNVVIEKALMQVRKGVEEGRTIVEPLKATDVFPPMVAQMIGVGEQTGALDAMLNKVADFYEDEVDVAIKNMLTAMEPIMLLVLGVVVGGIVISLYLPMFSLIGEMSGG